MIFFIIFQFSESVEIVFNEIKMHLNIQRMRAANCYQYWSCGWAFKLCWGPGMSQEIAERRAFPLIKADLPNLKKLKLAVREHNGGPIKGPLKLLNAVVLWWSKGSLSLHDGERYQSLGQLYVWSLLFFPVWAGYADILNHVAGL